jgi:hypothetical protein
MARFDADPYLSRREWMGRSAGIALGFTERIAAGAAQRKRIAAVITEYRVDSTPTSSLEDCSRATNITAGVKLLRLKWSPCIPTKCRRTT